MMKEMPQHRNVSGSQFGDNSNINLGDVALHYHLPHQPARTAIRVLPYPRNEDLVHRRDIVDKLERLLAPGATEYCSAALHGLGGSGYDLLSVFYDYISLIAAGKHRLRSIIRTEDVPTATAPSSGCTPIARRRLSTTSRSLRKS